MRSGRDVDGELYAGSSQRSSVHGAFRYRRLAEKDEASTFVEASRLHDWTIYAAVVVPLAAESAAYTLTL